jgi:hypothetical protein
MTLFVFCFLAVLYCHSFVYAQIVQPTSGTVLTIGTDGRFSSPTVVQWTSNKPATATVEITFRVFGGGLSIGDRNKLVFASPRFNATNVLKNVVTPPANVSSFDISQTTLVDFDGVPVKDAPVAAVTLLLSNTSSLHVEVSCKILEDGFKCIKNDDFEARPILRFTGGPCWFTNICAARGAPAEVRCATSGGNEYPCVCADGYQSDTPNGKCVRVATPTAGVSGVSIQTTTTGTGTATGVTSTAASGPGSDASMSLASRVSAGLASLFCLVALLFL